MTLKNDKVEVDIDINELRHFEVRTPTQLKQFIDLMLESTTVVQPPGFRTETKVEVVKEEVASG